jgi:resuscitation-promoting factor RpfB
MIGSLSNFRRSRRFRANVFRLGFAAICVGVLTSAGPAVVRASAQAKPVSTIPVANPATSVTAAPQITMPKSVGVTSQIVETEKLGTLISSTGSTGTTTSNTSTSPSNAGTVQSSPPPTNSPGVVVTEASPETTSPAVPAKKTTKRKRTTKAPIADETTAGPTEVPPPEAPKPEAGKPTQSQESILTALRKCESGGNYKTNTGNGYYGAYQFALGTWKKLGYSGYPHEAAPAVQDEAVLKLAAKAGWGQWPACSRKLGLR